MKKARILLVEDDFQALDTMKRTLELAGYQIDQATNGQEALEKARETAFDVVVSDVRMPKMGGLEFFRALRICSKNTPVILMTAYGRVEDAVWALKLGAVDFLTKPFKRKLLQEAIETALRRGKPQKPGPQAESQTDLADASPRMKAVIKLVDQVAATEATVLVTGESGVGKDLVAKAIHQRSARKNGPYIALNCASIPQSLIEAELYGYEKGAFSGAVSSKAGLFEAADGGTLFLDEIGDMPYELQANLLRSIQEGEIRRLGSTRSKKVNVRIVSATHRDLEVLVEDAHFRSDLLFRLDVVRVEIPPLRDRPEDVLQLSLKMVEKFSKRHSKSVKGLSDEVLQIFQRYPWPGNVRELSNVVERAVIFAGGAEITVDELPKHLAAGKVDEIKIPIGTPLKEAEDLLIRKTLEAAKGDKSMAAKILGVNSRTIYRRLEKGRETE